MRRKNIKGIALLLFQNTLFLLFPFSTPVDQKQERERKKLCWRERKKLFLTFWENCCLLARAGQMAPGKFSDEKNVLIKSPISWLLQKNSSFVINGKNYFCFDASRELFLKYLFCLLQTIMDFFCSRFNCKHAGHDGWHGGWVRASNPAVRGLKKSNPRRNRFLKQQLECGCENLLKLIKIVLHKAH